VLALLGYIHGLSLTSCDRRQPKHPLPHEKLMAFSLFSQSPSTILKKSETQSVRSLCTPYTPESLFPSLRYLLLSHIVFQLDHIASIPKIFVLSPPTLFGLPLAIRNSLNQQSWSCGPTCTREESFWPLRRSLCAAAPVRARKMHPEDRQPSRAG